MSSTEGLERGLEVVNTGKPISVPVGPGVMGRVLDVTGNPVDERGPVTADNYNPLHRPAPTLEDQSTSPQVLATGDAVDPAEKHHNQHQADEVAITSFAPQPFPLLLVVIRQLLWQSRSPLSGFERLAPRVVQIR